MVYYYLGKLFWGDIVPLQILLGSRLESEWLWVCCTVIDQSAVLCSVNGWAAS